MKGAVEKLKLEDLYKLFLWFFNGKKKPNFVRLLNLSKSETLNVFILTDDNISTKVFPGSCKIKFHENLNINDLPCALTRNVAIEELKPDLQFLTKENLSLVFPIKLEQLYDSKIFINSFAVAKCPNRDVTFTKDTEHFLVSMDLEMVKSERGKEAGRVSIVDQLGNVLYDKFVKPDYPILDYCTQYSGLTEDLLNRGISPKQMKEEIKDIIGKDTFILRHGLDNDMSALEMYHHKLIDTSYIFLNTESRRVSLKQLASSYLKKQVHQKEHSSVEDARLCLDLLALKIQQLKLATDESTEEIFIRAHVKRFTSCKNLFADTQNNFKVCLTHFKDLQENFIKTNSLNLVLYKQNNKFQIEFYTCSGY